MDAQPLYLAGLNVGGTATNVLYLATEHGTLYAFNADAPKLQPLWKTSLLGTEEGSSDDHGCGQITPEIGITSTPVIDRAKGVIYAVAMSEFKNPNGKYTYHQRLHALSLTSGSELAGSPVEITGNYPGRCELIQWQCDLRSCAVCGARRTAAAERNGLPRMDFALRHRGLYRVGDGL